MVKGLDINKRLIFVITIVLILLTLIFGWMNMPCDIPSQEAVVFIEGGRGTIPCIFKIYSDNSIRMIAGSWNYKLDLTLMGEKDFFNNIFYEKKVNISTEIKKEFDNIFNEIKYYGTPIEEFRIVIDDGPVVYCLVNNIVYSANYEYEDFIYHTINSKLRDIAHELVKLAPRRIKKCRKTNVRLGDGWFWDKFWYVI